MINAQNPLMKAWYELLSGNISVPVYRTSAPLDEKGNYVLIRFESENEDHIKLGIWQRMVVIIDIVTRFKNTVTDESANIIDGEISGLYRSLTGNNLPEQSGIQISNVYRESVRGLQEYDGAEYYYRLVARYSQSIFQN